MKSGHIAVIVIAAILAVMVLVMSYVPAKQGGAAPLSIGGGAQVTLPQQAAGLASIATVQIGDGQPKPIANLRSMVKDCEAGTYLTSGAAIQVYAADTDPSDSNANPILNWTAGTTDTTGTLYSNTDYKVIFTDVILGAGVGNNYYDLSYFGGSRSAVTAGKLTAPATTTATVDVTLGFDGAKCVYQNGTFEDILDESTTGGRINGQTNVTPTDDCDNAGTNHNEVGVGNDCSPANADTVFYNNTEGDGSFYLDLSLGVTGGNRVAKQPVICFKDTDGDMNKTQFTAIVTSRVSGDAWDGIPSDVLNQWKNDDCIRWSNSDVIDGGKSGIYRFTFTVSESNWANAEEFQIIMDDLGGWFTQDLHNDRRMGQSSMTISQDGP